MNSKWTGLSLFLCAFAVHAGSLKDSPASHDSKCALLVLTADTVVHDHAKGMDQEDILDDIWNQCQKSPNATPHSCGVFAQQLRKTVRTFYAMDEGFSNTIQQPDSPTSVENRAFVLKDYAKSHCDDLVRDAD